MVYGELFIGIKRLEMFARQKMKPTTRGIPRRSPIQVTNFFIPSDAIIIGGDFNCYDNALDKFGGNISIHKEYESLKNDFALVDVWRNLHPGSREFTWFNSPSLAGVD